MPLQETPREEIELSPNWERIECTGLGNDENMVQRLSYWLEYHGVEDPDFIEITDDKITAHKNPDIEDYELLRITLNYFSRQFPSLEITIY